MSDDSPTEQDPRFPSGPWFGFYRQGGTQSRQRFMLTFRSGRIDGQGRDPVAPFSIHGFYDLSTGNVSLTKFYGPYCVHYTGKAAGDGIPGAWEIRYGPGISDRGQFHIWPDELAMEEGLRLSAEEPVPASV